MSSISMPEDSNIPASEQAEAYLEELHPDFMAGMNVGTEGQHPEKASGIRTAFDIKDLHRKLQGMTDDELKSIPVLPAGARLEQGATYIDLRDSEPEEIVAVGTMEAEPRNWYVPKSEVDYVLWNQLIGVDNPGRLDQADEE